MAPSIPTCRPVLNATRMAVVVAVLAVSSSLFMVFRAPQVMASPAATGAIEQGCPVYLPT